MDQCLKGLSLDALEHLAQAQLPHAVFEYVAAGAGDESTVRHNRAAFDEWFLRQRVLVDVSTVDPSISLLGRWMPHPILLAPTAFHRAIHVEGERATAVGAARSGAVYVVSTSTTTPLESIAEAASGAPLWFQVYPHRDLKRTVALMQLAESLGFQALCVTVDNPVSGPRHRQERAGFALPEGLEAVYLADSSLGWNDLNRYHSATLTWADLEWIRSSTSLPVLLKGIMHPSDAVRAFAEGVDGLIVSNHGGRNLDSQPGAIGVFPQIREAVGAERTLLVDGGVRSGTAVFKALALGADAVLIGRPYLYGLAVAGAEGVHHVVSSLLAELEMAMALTGCLERADITKEVVWQ